MIKKFLAGQEFDDPADHTARAPIVISLSPQRLMETAELGRGLVCRLPGAGLLIVDAELHILVADGDAYQAVDRDGIVGRRVADVVPAAAWEVLEPRYMAALQGNVQSFDYTAVSESSTHSLRLAPIRDEGAVVGVMVLAEDITAKVAMTSQLADSERMQRSVLKVLDEGVIVLDVHGRLVQANPAACAILGLDPATARTDPAWSHPFRASRAKDGSHQDDFASVLKTGRRIRNVEIDADRPDGTRVTLSVNYRPLRDEAGAITGLVQSFRDVTEHERERLQLVEIQERLREAHEVAGLASWEWRPETDEVVIFHALPEDEHKPGDRMALDDLFETLPPEARLGGREDIASIVRGDRDGTVRRFSQPFPGGSLWLETRSRAVRDQDARLVCVRGTTQDVTEQEAAKQEAARARDFFQATLDSLSAEIAVLDEHGGIVMTNRAWLAFAAANGGTAIGPGENYLAACDSTPGDESATRAAKGLREIISGDRDTFSLEYPCHSPTLEGWFLLHAARFDGPGDARVVVSHEDVTQRHQAETQVATQAALLDEVGVAVIAADPKGRITHWNRGAEHLFGWTYAEALGRDPAKLVAPPGAKDLEEFNPKLDEHGHLEGTFTVCRKDGSTFPADLHGRVMVDSDGGLAGRIVVSVDVSERVASERALLAARNYMSAVADSMGEGLFTLDNQGRVMYMNEAGEKLLGWTRDELKGRVMHDVTHSHRSDGSELAIEDCPILHAGRDRRTLRVDDDVFFRRDGRQIPVAYTAAPFETDDGVEGCAVVFNDIAERKTNEESLQREADKLAWIGRIQDALAQDRFVLYAQPIVDLRSGKVVQSELLLRMREPNGEIVGPGSYLHIAEQYGLIGDIDLWVIERGVEVAATGRPVEINLSACSVGDQAVLDHIERCIQNTGADPALIVFEITETALVNDADAARDFAERLHSLGCKLALDDFGTGYGGFTYLKQLPVDYLKIDIEFVRDLATNPGSRHVVEAVVALARGFKLQTVAEGVEDSAAYELLHELGVDFAQGYHIARPGPLGPITPKSDHSPPEEHE